jgi:catechol 2,3-dioxygenase
VLGSHDEHPLVELQTRRGVMPARHGAFGLYHFAILLPDRAALGRFAAHIASLGIRVGMADHLVSELPSQHDVAAVGESLRAGGYHTEHDANGLLTADPWQTRMRILVNR